MGFNTEEYKDEFEQLPAGTYMTTLSDIELKDTQDGAGKFVKMTFEVLNDEYAGRKIFGNFLYEHPEHAKIGLTQISNFLRAIGKSGGFEIEDLYNYADQRVDIRMGMVTKGKNKGQTTIRAFVNPNANDNVAPTQAQPGQQSLDDVPF